jgi:hypothetical protein
VGKANSNLADVIIRLGLFDRYAIYTRSVTLLPASRFKEPENTLWDYESSEDNQEKKDFKVNC